MSDAVISNSYYGTYMLTNYLIEHGHEKLRISEHCCLQQVSQTVISVTGNPC